MRALQKLVESPGDTHWDGGEHECTVKGRGNT